MSSILKALKRIEGQSPPPEAFPALPESVDAKKVVNSTARKRWRLRRVMSVGLVLLIVVIATVTVFRYRKYLFSKISPAAPPATHLPKGQADGEKSKIFRAKIPMTAVKRPSKKTESKPSTRPAIKTVAPEQTSKKPSSIDRSAQTRMNVDEQASKSRPAASSRHPQSAAATDKPDPKPSARKKFTPSKKSIAGKRSASRKPAVAARKTTKARTKARTYAKLADAKIKLQALAWSSDATRRMAVINGRIVREGESMDGYQINQIRQDDVVVSDGRQSWRLEFGLKQ